MSFFNGFNPFIRPLPDEKSQSYRDTALGTAVAGCVGGARYFTLTGRDRTLSKVVRKILFSKPVAYSAAITGMLFLGTKTIAPIPHRKSS